MLPFIRVEKLLASTAAILSLLLAAAAQADPAVEGQWSPQENWPISTTHTHLLPDGMVFFWGEYDDGYTPYLWDPATGNLTSAPGPGYNPFCGGHTFLADGRLIAVGGHVASHVGLNDAAIYDGTSNTWTRLPDMNAGRWYPSAITLSNGDALVVSGEMADTSDFDPVHEVFEVATGKWRELTGAAMKIPFYPRMFVAPDGKVLIIDNQSTRTWWLDTTGTGTIIPGPPTLVADRTYGNAIMYEPGKIIRIGGGTTPTATTELIDLNQPNPVWTPGKSMASPRRQHNGTLLPDGTILVNGGSSGADFNDTTASVPFAELWDPQTGAWTTLATADGYRGYHSTGILVPDGRVLCGGGRTAIYDNSQVFSPPYLFKGPPPVPSQTPDQLWPAAPFRVVIPNADQIAKVAIIRLGSVTHSWNMNQRYITLSFQVEAGSGSLVVQGPTDNNAAPPGDYLLFLVDQTGVPSIGKTVQVVYGPTAGPAPGLDPLGADVGGDSDAGVDAGPPVSIPEPKVGSPNSGCGTTGGLSLALGAAILALGLGLRSRRIPR